ncbi:polysaccharide biosynthesis tyrosine autokinase [Allocoleopsis sp.]|uniref:GumC family protein n=1 Tax=Allocoleopsis sp. TaxID=3088169 RepID=UPI002FD05F90
MAESNPNTIPETDAGYGQLFAVLLRRRLWIVGVLCIVLPISTIKALREKPTYQSSMQLLVEPNYQSKGGAEGDKQFTDSNVQIDNVTQLRLMQSSQLIGKAVELLRHDYPNISVDEIKQFLTVSQVQDGKGDKSVTKLFEATYTDGNPVKTQKVLQAMQRVYQDYNREQQRLLLVRGLAFINTQLPKVRESVTQAEIALEQFRKRQNLIEPEEQAKTLVSAIASIEQERRTNEAQYKELQTRYKNIQEKLATSPQEALLSSRLSQSSRYQTLLNEIQKTDLAIAQQRIRFTDSSPVIQKLFLQRQEQVTLLQEEGQRILKKSSPSVSQSQENSLAQGQFANVDLELSNQLLQTQTNLAALAARDRTLVQTEQQLRAQLNRFPSLLAEYGRLQPDIQIKRDTLQQLEKAKQELSLEIARGGFDWQVVEAPQLGEASASKKKQSIMIGVVIGMFLGGVAAFVREMLDDAVHSPEDLQKCVNYPLLGITPDLLYLKKSKSLVKLPFSKPQDAASSASEPIIKLPFGRPEDQAPWTIEVIYWPPYWESLDLIYKNIQLQNSDSPFSPLMLTSAVAGPEKSIIALGLAISAARLHQRVLLIDADLRNPTLHKRLNLPNEDGLSTLLTSDATVPISRRIQSSSSYIDILTAGPAPADPANLLSSPRLGELIKVFEQTYDLVLLDASPVLGMVDAILAGSFCHCVVLAARIDKVTQAEIIEVTAMLSKLNLIGIISC